MLIKPVGCFVKRSVSLLQVRHLNRKTLSNMSSIKKQHFDHFFVLDFEATCLRNELIVPQEIIEFPCLKLSTETFEVESTFHRYVRPLVRPNLSHFCTELTGITQEMVEHESDFSEVFADFKKWVSEETNGTKDSFTAVICGDWDLKTMLPNQCQLSEVQIPEYFDQWINIKKSYHVAKKTFPRSLEAMIKGLNLVFQGRQHSGIDDSTNIARIVRILAEKGHVFVNTSSRVYVN